jgi:long-chain fatty acid transport protein
MFVLAACVALLPASALAQGAMLHGIGPVNSSMGGAGTALPNESLGALMFNPALIAGAQGNQISFTTEFFKDSIRIETTVGNLTGVMEPRAKLGVLPAFGWMSRHPQKKLAIGFGLLGIAGFRTDYHQSDESILFAQPPAGFGRIFTDYRVTKVPVAFAYQVNPKLAVGASLNVYIGEFAVSPLPHKVFDLDANNQNRFYPEAGSLASAYAVAPQFGFLYQHSPTMSIGAAFTLPQNFTKYEWNSTIANPALPTYGRARTLDFDLDGPMILSFGTALKNTKTQFAIDGMFTKYTGVEGFGSPGGVVDGIVFPFGWRNVWTFKTGVQHQVTEKLTVRAGYNYSNMPLRKEVVLTMTGAPATFQHHYSGGIGLRMFPFLQAEAGFYFVPRDHVVGPFPNLDNEVIGGMDTSNKLTSALIGLNFRF